MRVGVAVVSFALLSCGGGSEPEPQDTGPVEFECLYDCSLDSPLMVGGELTIAVHGLRVWVPHTVRSLAPAVMTARVHQELTEDRLDCIVPHCIDEPQIVVSPLLPGEARIVIENDRGVRAELTLRAELDANLLLDVSLLLGEGTEQRLEPTYVVPFPAYTLTAGDNVFLRSTALDENEEPLIGERIDWRSTNANVLGGTGGLESFVGFLMSAGEVGYADLYAATQTSEYRFGFEVVAPPP